MEPTTLEEALAQIATMQEEIDSQTDQITDLQTTLEEVEAARDANYASGQIFYQQSLAAKDLAYEQSAVIAESADTPELAAGMIRALKRPGA
jgi:multidrug resistance efflux pump